MQSGQTLAVMGPSGAGKTTFMDLLTLEGSGGSRTGYVDINGKPLTPEVFRQYCAYVPQFDQGWPFLTCAEAVQFAASFFVTDSSAEKERRTNEIIQTMGLESCRNTKVGNEFLKGLSGGQRRRLSLAIAFMKDPLVVFLDEVTSGLDSASAASIIKFLQQLARDQDVIIACTIHQPSARIFAGFDKLLLLSGGRVAYSGKVPDAVDHFQNLGFAIPEHENPADFFLDSINADFTEKAQVEKVLQAWELQPFRAGSGSFDMDHDLRKHSGQQRHIEVWCLFRRMVLLARRDPTIYASRAFVFVFACLFFAIVYINSRDRIQSQALQRVWVLLWHIGVPSIMSLATCLGQNLEFNAVKREVKAGMYRLSSYFVAQMLLQIPLLVILSAMALTFSGYVLLSWNWDAYGEVLLVHSLNLFVFDSAAQFFAVSFHHPLLGLFQVICMWFASFLFAGVLVPEEDVIWPLRAFAIVSPIKWTTKAIVNAELLGTTFEGAVLDDSSPLGFSCPDLIPMECFGATGLQVLNSLKSNIARNVSPVKELEKDCGILLGCAMVFRVLYFVTAALRCRSGQAVKAPKEGDSPQKKPSLQTMKQARTS